MYQNTLFGQFCIYRNETLDYQNNINKYNNEQQKSSTIIYPKTQYNIWDFITGESIVSNNSTTKLNYSLPMWQSSPIVPTMNIPIYNQDNFLLLNMNNNNDDTPLQYNTMLSEIANYNCDDMNKCYNENNDNKKKVYMDWIQNYIKYEKNNNINGNIITNNTSRKDTKNNNINERNEPFSFIYYPIIIGQNNNNNNDKNDTTNHINQKIIGTFSIAYFWKDYFHNIFISDDNNNNNNAKNKNNDMIVVLNNNCNQTVTYRIVSYYIYVLHLLRLFYITYFEAN